MDGDAKGQLGGLDVDNNVRREWAVRSRRWRCDVCNNGGRTNEEVLDEWRAFCREKGVLDDDDDDDRGGGGSKEDNGKDESREKRKRNEATLNSAGEEDIAPPRHDEKEMVMMSSSSAASARNGDVISPTTRNADISSPSSSAQPQPQLQQPSQSTLSPSPVQLLEHQHREHSTAIPTITNTTATPARSSRDDDVWLDRTILGVILALALLVLKRILNSYYDDYL